jgi:hypothetical protein
MIAPKGLLGQFSDSRSPTQRSTYPKTHIFIEEFGAHDGNRTRDLFLTKEVLYRLSYMGIIYAAYTCSHPTVKLERETGFEPATPSLEGSRSTN